jgi:hypothetical protein
MATMMTAAIVVGASVLALHGSACAQAGRANAPSEADFDVCNREAGLRSVASASPRAERPAGAPVSSPGSTVIGSGASVGAGAAAGGPSSGGSTLDGGGAFTSSMRITTEPEPPGMASAGFTDPVYQRAYRDCLRRKGF